MKTCTGSKTTGFTLLEVMLAVAVAGILLLAIAASSNAVLTGLKASNLRTSRDQVVTQLRMTATDKMAIAVTLKKPENVAMFNCACGVGTCTNMQQPFQPVTLYDSSDIVQSPRFYTADGFPCAATDANCSIRVATTFFAQCPPDYTNPNQNPALTCNGTPAEFISIVYTVDENPGAVAQANNPLRTVSGPVYIQMADLAPGACTP